MKNLLSDVIKKENKRKPLSDEKLKEILLGKGYNIARRTVAKYREQLNIPVARLRKELWAKFKFIRVWVFDAIKTYLLINLKTTYYLDS